MSILTKENATLEFQRIVKHFGFYVPEEVKLQKIETKTGGMTVSMQQEIDQAADFIQKIMEGKISFNEKEEAIIYNLPKSLTVGENTIIKDFRFGSFTKGIQKGTGVQLVDLNMNMNDDQWEKVLMAMTGTSDVKVLDALGVNQYNDLRMVARYFFN